MDSRLHQNWVRGQNFERDQAVWRNGFTLIELVIVILIILILTTLTVTMVGNVLDDDRVRGGARQIQNYLAGARDRAIYSASRMEGTGTPPRVGVRFLSDPALFDTATNRHRGFSSMVFVQEIAPMPTQLRLWEDNSGVWHASQIDELGEPIDSLVIRSVRSLIDRNLIESRIEPPSGRVYYLEVTFDEFAAGQTFYIRFTSSNIAGNGRLADGILSRTPGTGTQKELTAYCHIRLLAAPMPNEEPRVLPQNVVIDAQSSMVGGAPNPRMNSSPNMLLQRRMRADGSFDVMFNSQGVIDGPLAAEGLIHFVVTDLEDLERGFRLTQIYDPNPDPAIINDEYVINGTPFVDSDGDGNWDDSDGDGNFDERAQAVRIVSIRARTGSIYASDINPEIYPTGSPNAGRYIDPFEFAEIGGEAR